MGFRGSAGSDPGAADSSLDLPNASVTTGEMKWLAWLLPLFLCTACVSSSEKAQLDSAKSEMEEQRRRDWEALTPAQREHFHMEKPPQARE
jgi:hypothetical protein